MHDEQNKDKILEIEEFGSVLRSKDSLL